MDVNELINRLEEFKAPLVADVAALQGVNPAPDVEAKIWQCLTDTANQIRSGRPYEPAGLEQHCHHVLHSFHVVIPEPVEAVMAPPAGESKQAPKKK